ncbi:MAG: CHASE2 domain-containing protein [Flammeovirgaceae bacterium]|nr:MAG: CHASE2 domain-containing protein [Flammeovirgaceae bacterium]
MRKFWLDCFAGSAFVFMVLGGLYGITQLRVFDAFDPLGQALGDMELTDIAFSQIREDPPMDTNIVIVNIGYLSRAEIGQQIINLSKHKPKVIGLDIIFSCDWLQDSTICPQAYDTMGNMYFAYAIQQAGNVVMAHKLQQTAKLVKKFGDIDVYDSIEHTYPTLMPGAYEGFVNLETEAAHQEDLKACRRFNPKMMVNGQRELAFSVRMAMIYDSVKTNRFLARDNELEVINYKGNIVDWHGASNYAGRYIVLDWDQALDTTQFVGEMIKDKIVIMGFLGGDLTDTSWDDKFFTPLNKKYAGKARPDMYGVVVHANIVSMILEEDYIEVLKTWQEIAIAIVVCFLNVALFVYIMDKNEKWFDAISVTVQLFQIVLFSFLMIEFLNWFNFKFNVTWTLAVVAVVGTSFELYNGVIKSLAEYLKNRFLLFKSRWFTKKGQ